MKEELLQSGKPSVGFGRMGNWGEGLPSGTPCLKCVQCSQAKLPRHTRSDPVEPAMIGRPLQIFAILVVASLLSLHAAGQLQPEKTEPKQQFTAEQVAFFEKEVLPILKANCFKCHGG